MAKTLVNQKRDELKKLNPRKLIDRICRFSDQELLNSGKYPLGSMATQIRNDDYRMTENQYYALIHNFARVTIAEVDKPSWVSDPDVFRLKPRPQMETMGFPANFQLTPTDDKVQVALPNINGDPMPLGFLPLSLLKHHPILEPVNASGQMSIARIGDAVMFSYQMSLDLELLDAKADEVRAERLAKLTGSRPISDGLGLTEADLKFEDGDGLRV